MIKLLIKLIHKTKKDELTKYTTSEKFVCNPFIDDGKILT